VAGDRAPDLDPLILEERSDDDVGVLGDASCTVPPETDLADVAPLTERVERVRR
jgi:hypothetical protein